MTAPWRPGRRETETGPVRCILPGCNRCRGRTRSASKILLEAGLAVNKQLYDFSQHRYVPGHQDIPRVVEFGSTVGMDDVSPLVNAVVGHFRGAVRQPEQRSWRRGGISQPRRLPPARVDLVRHRLAQREVRISTAGTSLREGTTPPATRA